MAVIHSAAASNSTTTHVADPALAPFLQPQFDPADYLNATLPSLSLSSVASRPLKQGTSVSLAELSSQTQDLLSQLNAHTTRLSTILAQLTDDILRSGARLAYEVEVLRGETSSLTETLTDGLKPDVSKFVPGGLSLPKAPTDHVDVASPVPADHPASEENPKSADAEADPATSTPDYISHLRVLTLVRTRLDAVIKVFGEALHWTLPPSDLSLTSGLISVSGPDSASDVSTREQKGKEFAAALRAEIADLIAGDPDQGVDAAQIRIQALRDLAVVWKGTAEEKARAKFIDGLVKIVEERQRDVEKEKRKGARGGLATVQKTAAAAAAAPAPAPQRSGGGFLDNLQRIRETYI